MIFGGVPHLGCAGKGKGTPISSCDIKKKMIFGGVSHLGCAGKGKGTRSRKKIKKKKDMEMKEDDEPLPLHLYELGRKMILPEDSKTLYATNLDHPIGGRLVEADIVDFFRDVGKVVKVEIVPKTRSLIDFAKIEFESHDVAKKAMEMKAHHYLFQTPIQLDGLPESEVPCYNMTDCTNERQMISCFGFGKAISLCELQSELEKYFSSVGEVDKVRVPLNDNGLSVGCAYIEFKNEESFKRAFELDRTLFLDSTLHVRRAKVFVTSC